MIIEMYFTFFEHINTHYLSWSHNGDFIIIYVEYRRINYPSILQISKIDVQRNEHGAYN